VVKFGEEGCTGSSEEYGSVRETGHVIEARKNDRDVFQHVKWLEEITCFELPVIKTAPFEEKKIELGFGFVVGF